jgi:purine-binding chemotaxis protein CheW
LRIQFPSLPLIRAAGGDDINMGLHSMSVNTTDDEVTLERLLFRVGQEEYGVDIRKVREIRNYETPTQILNVPAYLKGVINLRGLIVPIVDMRVKLGHETVQYDQQTVVIVLQIDGQTTGVVVDGVSDVAAISSSQIKPAPQFSGKSSTDYIQGLASFDGRMVILVDMERMLEEELSDIEAEALNVVDQSRNT